MVGTLRLVASVRRVIHFQHFADPKVNQPGLLIRAKNYVLRLDVPMQNASQVAVLDAACHLANHCLDRRFTHVAIGINTLRLQIGGEFVRFRAPVEDLATRAVFHDED